MMLPLASLRLSSSSSLRINRRSLHSSRQSPHGSDKIVKHLETEENNENTPFDFTPENWIKAKAILAKYPSNYARAACLPLLDLAQRQYGGWLPISAMNKCADVMGIPPMWVYESASFYSMFNRSPVGKYFVQVCGTTPCEIRGSNEIMAACVETLGIKPGQTSADRRFTLLEVECLGACSHAPMIQVAAPSTVNTDAYYEDLTVESTIAVLEKLKKDEVPKPGSQIGRIGCEPATGRKTLLEKPLGPYAPFLEELDKAEKTAAQ